MPAEESLAEDESKHSSSSILTLRDVVPVTVTPGRSGSRPGCIEMSDGLILQDLSEPNSGIEDGIPLQNLEKSTPRLNSSPAAANKVSPKGRLEETRMLEDPASGSSCSSGAAEVQAVLSKQLLHGDVRCKVFPPEGSKSSESKSRARAKSGGNSSEKFSLDCLDDSSSGSDLDTPKPSSKARSLRKTKSRGKGKGRTGLSPVDGLDELGFENHGIGEEDRKRRKDGPTLPKGKHKQCWT